MSAAGPRVPAALRPIKVYELLTQARTKIMQAQPMTSTWLHKGTEKSAVRLLDDALAALDAAIERTKGG